VKPSLEDLVSTQSPSQQGLSHQLWQHQGMCMSSLSQDYSQYCNELSSCPFAYSNSSISHTL